MTDTSVDSTADQSKQAASEVAGDARGKAQDVKGTAKQEAKSVVDDARDQASDVVGTARSELRTQASEQAKSLSSTMNDLGRQLGDMADGSDDPEAQMAQLVRSAADTMSDRAKRIEDGGVDGIVDDLKRFARNRPGAFLLSTVAGGFAIGRLAKHADLKQAGQNAKGEIDTDKLKPGDSNDGSASTASSYTSDTSKTAKGDTGNASSADNSAARSGSASGVTPTAGGAAPATPMAPTAKPPTGRQVPGEAGRP